MTSVKSQQRCAGAVDRKTPSNGDGLVSISIAVYTHGEFCRCVRSAAPRSLDDIARSQTPYLPAAAASAARDSVGGRLERDEEARYFITIARHRLLPLSSSPPRLDRSSTPDRCSAS